MGTHPIFESDFDCLTECYSSAKIFDKKKNQFFEFADKEKWSICQFMLG